jgi:dienelactone hydrolase
MLAMMILAAVFVHAEIRTEPVEYRDGNTVLEGYISFDSKSAAKRPGVLIVHDWMGVGPYVKKRAEELAKLGYTAMAVDIYGKGVRPKNPKEAGELAGKYKGDRALYRRRLQLGLSQLEKHMTVDKSRMAAMGYCFGGTGALELGRAGAPLKGIVSFHGGLDTPTPKDARNIKGKVLVLHGADDPYVPEDQVKAFEDEMRTAGLDWQLVKYSKAVHAFTNPEAGNDPSKGAAYNAEADKRSWEAMKVFFAEIF